MKKAVVVIVLGVTVGLCGYAHADKKEHSGRGNGRASQAIRSLGRADVVADLGLTEEQRTQIETIKKTAEGTMRKKREEFSAVADPLREEFRKKMQPLEEGLRNDTLQIQDEQLASITAVLTPEQMQKLTVASEKPRTNDWVSHKKKTVEEKTK